MIYYQEIRRIYNELVARKDLLEKELSCLPEGDLFIYTSHGMKSYAERIPAKGNIKKEKRTGIKRDRDRLNKLVRKKYVSSAIDILDRNIAAMDSLLKKYRPADENSVMKAFVEKHPELTDGIYYGLMSYDEWAKNFESAEGYHPENLKSTSADGSRKRSLGEIIIGSRLDYYGIPYRYEASINHPDIPYAPDFTIIRPRDNKIIYWEHLGNVNDESYMSYSKHKLEYYERYGIVPWDNLIVSYSQPDYGINEKLIDSLIQGWLL